MLVTLADAGPLGVLGRLRGRPWTTHWEDVEDLGALSSGIAMALHLVDRFAGRDLALLTARQIEYEWDPEAPRRT